MESAVLLIIYRRYDSASKVLSVIRQAKPKLLFIAADGPREEKDIEKCNQARKIAEEIDWDCQVQTLFQEENLGCGKGPATAISWFFSHVEEGIILEDDCYPHISFFTFCDQMLERYRDDTRIMHVGGTNHHLGEKYGNASYFFSRINACWGWATWRRAWAHFDFETKGFEQFRYQNRIFDLFSNREMAQFVIDKFETGYVNNYEGIWDYQWQFTFLANSGLAIMPNKNLIKNIGFGEDAIHTKNRDIRYDQIKLEELDFPIQHPNYVTISQKADENTYLNWYKPKKQSIPTRMINKAKRVLLPLKQVLTG